MEWDAAHAAVPGFAAGAVYAADPSLPQVNGHEGSRYFAVLHEGGRVLQYDIADWGLRKSTEVDALIDRDRISISTEATDGTKAADGDALPRRSS